MEDRELKIFNASLKKLRIKNRMTLSEIAKALNISYTYLSKCSNGHRKPSSVLVNAISDYASLSTTEKLKALSDTPIDFFEVNEPSPTYEKPKIFEFLQAELEKKNEHLDKILEDQRKRTDQMDRIIVEIQKLTNLTIELSKKL